MFRANIKRSVLPLPLACFFALQFIPAMGLADNNIYQYTDDAGTLNFTSEWSSIPEKYRSQIKTVYARPPQASPPASAAPVANAPPDVRIVTASGEYRMGDHDTRYDAERLAVEAAKRNALEQVATYVESVTVATNLDLTRDDIRTYTAGLVLVRDQRITPMLDGKTVVIHVDLTAEVDANEVVQAVTALRQSQDARTELVAVRQENEQLQQQLTELNQRIAAATDPQQAQVLTQERQGLLDQVQSNALVSQAWTDYVIAQGAIVPYPWYVVGQARSLLWQARALRPNNPHVIVGQQVIAPQGLAPAAAFPQGERGPGSRHARHMQTPLWPSGQPRPAFSAGMRNTLPPTIHQLQPAPPQPVPRYQFRLPSTSLPSAQSHHEGRHSGGGHHK